MLCLFLRFSLFDITFVLFLILGNQLLICNMISSKCQTTACKVKRKCQANNILGVFLCEEIPQCAVTAAKPFLNFNSTSVQRAICPQCKSTVKLCPSLSLITASPAQSLTLTFTSVFPSCLAQAEPQLSRTKGGQSCERLAGMYILYILGHPRCIFLECQL